jgi:hypothetical protein
MKNEKKARIIYEKLGVDLFELYPWATGVWEEDKVQFIRCYIENEDITPFDEFDDILNNM